MNEILLREWQTVGPSDHPALASPSQLSQEESEQISELNRSRQIEILEVRGGWRVSTRSYVGLVRLGQTTLHIRPKLAELSPAGMATFLRYALGMKMVPGWNETTDVPVEAGGFVDLIAQALLEETNALLRAGFLRDYETQMAWRSSPRGRLDLMEFARHPMRGQTTAAIPCRISERVTDIALNRLLLATLNAVRALVTDPGLVFNLHSRSALLGELCRAVPLTSALLIEATVDIDRRSAHYQPILEIAGLILQGMGATVDQSPHRTSLSTFLLDMNLLFERFLGRLLCEYGPPALRVETQVNQGSAYRWQENPFRWKRPRLRPDIVLYEKATDTPRLILDAKYKPLGAGRSPSPEDLYQLTLYSLSFRALGYVPARIVFPTAISLTTHSIPCLDFHGLSPGHTLACISFYGLPILSVTDMLRSEDENSLREIGNALCVAS